MKIKNFLLFLPVLASLYACQSVQSVQKQLRTVRADLDYALASPIYTGTPEQTVYLNLIEHSGMELFTTVKGGNAVVFPFLLFNYWHKKFNVELGESTLTQLYRDFLTDALLAECNRSACFNLKTGDSVPVSGGYSLDVKIIHNKTLSGIRETNYMFIYPLPHNSMFSFANTDFHVLPAVSHLEITVSLKKDGQRLWGKNYTAQIKKENSEFGDLVFAGEQCVFKMTDCLSLATEQIVTAISQDLNMVLSAQ